MEPKRPRRPSGDVLQWDGKLRNIDERESEGWLRIILVEVDTEEDRMAVLTHPLLSTNPELLTDAWIERVADRVAHTLRVLRAKTLSSRGELKQ